MSWLADLPLHVDIALDSGALSAAPPKLKLAIGTGTASVSDARIGHGAIGVTQRTGAFTIGHATYGRIGTGGRIPGDWFAEASFVAVEASCRSVQITRSKPGRLSSFDTATCTIVLNDSSRDFDPLNTGGPYTAGGTTLCRRGRRVRVYTTYEGVRRYLFSGFVDSWSASLTQFEAATRTVECSDWAGLLALYDGYEKPAVGAGETVDVRINRWLDLVEVPATNRDIGTSTVTLQSTTLADNALTAIKQAAACDGGDVWISADGKVTFRSRVAKWASTRTLTTQFAVTNANTLTGTETTYGGVPEITESDTITGVFLAAAGSTSQIATDTALKDLFGWITHERTDLINSSDADVLALANYLIRSQPAQPHLVRAVEVRPDIHAHARPLALTSLIWDRVSVTYTAPVASVPTMTSVGLIVGVEHLITAGAAPSWRARFLLEDITGVDPATF